MPRLADVIVIEIGRETGATSMYLVAATCAVAHVEGVTFAAVVAARPAFRGADAHDSNVKTYLCNMKLSGEVERLASRLKEKPKIDATNMVGGAGGARSSPRAASQNLLT